MKLASLIILFFYSITFLAQRPKVGLVLSGGGAKGFAHIGVIKELEKAGIKPDIITGTSMGSIVGALYALGYSTDEMEKIVEVVDWDNVISNKLPYDRITMPENPYDSRYITELEISKSKVWLPKGLIEGKELAMLMDMLTIPGHQIKDFKKFPIPFACVATDITNGDIVVLDSGNINEAIRASMAIPSIFTPIKYDGRLLVDGGMVRNFPVQEAINMGAEYIIGSNVGGDFIPEEELSSMIDVLSQSAFVMSTLDSREQTKLCNVVIEPPIKNYSAGDFNLGAEIINTGQNEAKKFNERFKRIADSLDALGAYQKPVPIPIDSNFKITDFLIVGNTHLSDDKIARKLDFNKDKTYSNEDIIDHVSVLFGTKYYDDIHYNLIPNGDSSYCFKVNVKESADAKIKGAFHYDSENGTGLDINLTIRNLIFKHSRFITEIDIATQPRTNINYLKYIGKRQNQFILLDFKWYNFDLPIYENGQKTSLWRTNDLETNLQFNKTIGTNILLGGMAGFSYLNMNPEINEGSLKNIERVKETIPYVRIKFEANSTDKRYFATKGVKIYTDISYSNSLATDIFVKDTNSVEDEKTITNDQLSLTFRHRQHLEVASKLTAIWQNSLVFSLSDQSTFSTTNFVGGFNPYFINTINFAGAQAYEYQVTNCLVSKISLQWEFLSGFYLLGGFEYAETAFPLQPESNGIFDNNLGNLPRRFASQVSLAYMSALGPVSVAVGKDFQKSGFTTNFTLGFWYK